MDVRDGVVGNVAGGGSDDAAIGERGNGGLESCLT